MMTAWVKEENDLPGQPEIHAAMTKEVKGPILHEGQQSCNRDVLGKSSKVAVNDRNRCDFFYTKWGNFLGWPRLVFDFRFFSVQTRFTACLFCCALFYSVQRRGHLDSGWLLHLLHSATRPSVFVGRMSCRLVHDSLCISHQAHGERQGLGVCTSCFIYNAMIFVFPSADLRRLWEGGREGGMEGWRRGARQRRRRDTKRRVRDVNRSCTKNKKKKQTKGLMESRKGAEKGKRIVIVNR